MSAAWLDRIGTSRLRVYPMLILAIVVVVYAGWVVMGKGLVDPSGRAVAADFSAFHAAGRLVNQGRAVEVYDLAALRTQMHTTLGADVGDLPIHYPPPALLLFSLVGKLPYALAAFLWMSLCVAAVAGVAALATEDAVARRWLWASPAALLGVLNGQTGPGIGLCAVAAVVLMARRPLLAGVCAGLLVLKPTFAPVVFFALLVTGRWRALAVAVGTAVALCGVSYQAFGPDVWRAWVSDAALAQRILYEGGVPWAKMPTVAASVLGLGLSETTAKLVQAGAAGLAFTAVVVARLRHREDLLPLVVVLGSVLCTPFAFDYDLVLTLVAVVVVAQHALRTESKVASVVAALLWLLPFLLQPLARVGAPVAPLLLLGVVVWSFTWPEPDTPEPPLAPAVR